MKRRFLTAIIIAMVALSALPAAVSADSTKNYAGRTLTSTSAGSEGANETKCQMLAYGKVDNRPVIFTANHCFTGKQAFDGRTIVDEDLNGYANTVTSQSHCSSQHDLCFMWLKTGKWPSNPHQVYGGNVGGVLKWSTISTVRGSSWYSCANMGGQEGAGVFEYQQDIQNGVNPAVQGVFLRETTSPPCQIYTDIPYSATYRHSGSPLMTNSPGNPGSILGVGTRMFDNTMIYSSVYEGMLDIHGYWQSRGTYTGAHFCTTAAC